MNKFLVRLVNTLIRFVIYIHGNVNFKLFLMLLCFQKLKLCNLPTTKFTPSLFQPYIILFRVCNLMAL